MSQPRRSDAGVTLIEVLVSLAIFAVIGLAGLTVLDTVMRTGARTEGRLEQLADIDRAFLVIRRDLAQMARGETRLQDNAVRFRRLSTEDAFDIAYRHDDTTLYRQITGGRPDPVAQTLLEGVVAAQWRLLDMSDRWVATWPSAGEAATPPKAAELTLEFARAASGTPQSVTRLFLLPAGQAQ